MVADFGDPLWVGKGVLAWAARGKARERFTFYFPRRFFYDAMDDKSGKMVSSSQDGSRRVRFLQNP